MDGVLITPVEDFTFDEVDYMLNQYSTSVLALNESFEHLVRLSDTERILNDWISDSKDNLALESSTKTVIELALAGTDFVVDDVSTESVTELAKSIGKAILSLIKRIFDKLVDVFTNIDITATWMIRMIRLMERKRITSRGRIPDKPNVTLGANHRFLRVGRIFPDQPTKLQSEVKRYSELVKIVGNDYPTMVASGVKDIRTRVGSKTGGELEQAILDAVNSMGFNTIAGRIRMSSNTTRWGKMNAKEAEPYLGGRSLFFIDGNLSQKRLSGLRTHGFRFTDTYQSRFNEASEREFVSLTTSTLEGIPKQLEEMMMAISNSSSKRVMSSLKDSRNAIEGLITSRANNATEEDMKALRQAANAVISWSKNVADPVFGNGLQVCRAVLAYGQASLKNLK